MTPWHDRPWPRAALTAVQFLSRIPVPGGTTRSLDTFPQDIARGLPLFPLIGALLGAITGTVVLLADTIFTLPLAILIALAFDLRLTGCFHEDAVADFADAFGGGWTREDTLRILADSRIGAYGAAALVSALALRAAACMAQPDAWHVAAALVVAGCVGRLMILVLMVAIPPVPGRESLARDIGQRAGVGAVTRGMLFAAPFLLPAILWEPWRMLAAVTTTAFLALWLRALLLRRLGGVTGDALGFGAYGAMLLTLLALAAAR